MKKIKYFLKMAMLSLLLVCAVVVGSGKAAEAAESVSDETSMTFKIGKSDDESMDATVTFRNDTRTGQVTLTKTDANDNLLPGVEFTLYDSDGNEVDKQTSGDDGTLVFEEIPIGEYTIQETNAVAGNSLLKDPISVTIPLSMTEAEAEEQEADTTDAVLKDGNYYFYEFAYDVSNHARLDIPSTGGAIDYSLLILGLGVVMFGCLYLMGIRKLGKADIRS